MPKNGPRGWGGQKQWYMSFQNPLRNQCAEMSEAQDSELKIGYFKIWISRLFFQKKISKKFILKPIFYSKLIKFGKNLIYHSNILYEKWHILKENHETKMSKITHSAQHWPWIHSHIRNNSERLIRLLIIIEYSSGYWEC